MHLEAGEGASQEELCVPIQQLCAYLTRAVAAFECEEVMLLQGPAGGRMRQSISDGLPPDERRGSDMHHLDSRPHGEGSRSPPRGGSLRV